MRIWTAALLICLPLAAAACKNEHTSSTASDGTGTGGGSIPSPTGPGGINPAPGPGSGADVPQTVGAFEKKVFELVNAERAKAGLAPFKYSLVLQESAYLHAKDMGDNNYFDHSSRDGSSPFDRMKRVGYLLVGRSAENIAAGQDTPEDVMNSWMNSSGHRANILGATLEMGVGYYYSKSNQYGHYWVQNFGSFDSTKCTRTGGNPVWSCSK